MSTNSDDAVPEAQPVDGLSDVSVAGMAAGALHISLGPVLLFLI